MKCLDEVAVKTIEYAIVTSAGDCVCVAQNIIPTNKPGAEPKRPGRPVNITHLCDLSASVVNNIIVTWNVEEDRVGAVSCFFSQTLVSSKRNNIYISGYLCIVF